MEYINLDLIVVYTIHNKIPTPLIMKESVNPVLKETVEQIN